MRRFAFLIPLLLTVAAPAIAGQQPPGEGSATTPVTIRVFGGLLGQVEGFCEDPGGTYDWYMRETRDPKKPDPRKTELAGRLADCPPSNGQRGSKWLGGALAVAD